MAISMQRAVSEMWMKARVWPPVPYTVSGMFSDACKTTKRPGVGVPGCESRAALPGGAMALSSRTCMRKLAGGLVCLDVSGWTPQHSTSRRAHGAHLHEEAIEDGAVVAVVVEAVDQALVADLRV